MRPTSLRRFGREQPAAATDPYLIFTVHDVRYAAPLSSVREVVDRAHLSPVADAPEALIGTQVLRGHRLPVVDLGAVFEQRRLRPTRSSCTLVLQAEPRADLEVDLETGVFVGLAVDGVTGVKGLAAADLASSPRLGQVVEMDVVAALASTDQGLVPVVDLARILASPDVARAVAAWHAAEAASVDSIPVGRA